MANRRVVVVAERAVSQVTEPAFCEFVLVTVWISPGLDS